MAMRIIRFNPKSVPSGVHFRWSAISSATFAILGTGLFFLLLGNAVGLSIHNIVNPSVGTALRVGTWIYMAVTMIFSYYIGSLLGTRSPEVYTAGSGALHGLVAWGFASYLAALLAQTLSAGASQILLGTGTNSGNWLALCVVGLGLAAAVGAGMTGKRSAAQIGKMDETEKNKRGRVA